MGNSVSKEIKRATCKGWGSGCSSNPPPPPPPPPPPIYPPDATSFTVDVIERSHIDFSKNVKDDKVLYHNMHIKLVTLPQKGILYVGVLPAKLNEQYLINSITYLSNLRECSSTTKDSFSYKAIARKESVVAIVNINN